ncbi:hypothetical protein [Haloarcula laminariae]|uniref:hypothetical protein n=1 Tax=Haloarcula laminariae TaxID=2961577 RepID=UPI0021CA9171|nr:hypothetical protein [Halomicroarcula laminariae]
MPEVVSVVGGDDLGIELNLPSLYADIEAKNKKYEPASYPGLCLQFEEDGATIMVFSSGKYNIAGAESIVELYATHRKFVRQVSNMLEREIEVKNTCELRNLVYRGDFGSKLRLEALIPFLGIENIEYEPESFPALDYRPPEYEGLFKIFATGKVTLSGVTDPENAEDEFESLYQKLQEVIEST